MRSLIPLLIGSFISTSLYSQSATEVYASEVEISESGFQFNNFKNISANPGYDNQPYFLSNDTLVYARTNDGQTDIAQYSFSKQESEFYHKTTPGGEYSPQPIPGKKTLAAVRLDPDGMQRLYAYSAKEGETIRLFPSLKVAYFTFINEEEILASIIRVNQLDLIRANNSTGEFTELVTNSGRCLQKIQGTETYSYTALNEEKNFDLYQYDPKTNESYFVCQLPVGVQDYIWYGDYRIIIGSGTQLFVYDLYGNGDWQPIANLKGQNLTNITRLALSPDHKRFAFVAEPLKE